jgi:outer membrane phospholipase A
MRRAGRVIVLALALLPPAARATSGAGPVLTIVAPPELRPGDVVRIDLVGLNPGLGEELRLDAAPTLSGALRTATTSSPAALATTSNAPVPVAPRGFAVRTYTMTVPDAPDGEAVLTVTVDGREIAAATRVARDGATETRRALAPSPAIEAFPRILPGRISIYQPNYYIYGTGGEPGAKFQLSFKYRVLTFGRGTPERPRPTLQLAYTQRSLWDITGPSSPFFDTSYMPELFVESLKPPSARQGRFSFLGWGAGYRHESNGKGGDDSRSLDMAYARAIFAVGTPDSWYLGVAPEVWHYLDDMPQIADYRGRGKVYFLAGHGSGPSLSWTVTPGDGLDHVTHELGLSIPAGVRSLGFATFMYVQYFDGWAESIRSYTHYSQSIRVGLSLVR